MKTRLQETIQATVTAEVPIDEEIEISMSDLIDEFLSEACFLDPSRRMNLMEPGSVAGELSALLDRINKVLTLVPASVIEQMSLELRRHHRSRLFEQANRY